MTEREAQPRRRDPEPAHAARAHEVSPRARVGAEAAPTGKSSLADALTAGLAGGVIRRAPLAIAPATPAALDDAAPAAIATARAAGGGRALDTDARARLEACFGVALGDIRIHDGAAAAQAATALAARAFTQGSDIFFAAGAYDPGSTAGFELLAHEVAHTRQASGGSGVGAADHRDEHDADAAASAAVRGAPAPLAGESGDARATDPVGDARAAADPSVAGNTVRLRRMPRFGGTRLGVVRFGGERPHSLHLEAQIELVPPGTRPGGFDGFAGLDQAEARAAQSPYVNVIVVDPDHRYHAFSTGLVPPTRFEADGSPIPISQSLLGQAGVFNAVRIVGLHADTPRTSAPGVPLADALSARAAEQEGEGTPDDRDRQPWHHGRQTEHALANLQRGHADPLDRARLAGAIEEQVPDVALMREVAHGAQAVITLVMPGTGRLSVKNMNDHLVGYEINASRVVRPMQAAIAQTFHTAFQPIDQTYKSSTFTSREAADTTARRVPSLLPQVDGAARTILVGAFHEAIAYWRGRSDERVHEMEALLPVIDRTGFQYPLTHGTAAIDRASGATPTYAAALAARMHATEGALMSRSVDEPSLGDGAPGAGRGQTYDRAAFVRFAQEAEALRAQIRATNQLTYAGTTHQVFVSAGGHEQLNTEVVQDFRRGRIVAPVERETYEQFRRYMHHINAFDYLKDFRGNETPAVGQRIEQARAVIAQLEGGRPVDAGVVADLVHHNAATGQIDPQADTASAGVFYEAARQHHNRIVVRADIRGLGADLAQGYARATTATAAPGADLDTIARAANDPVVDVRRRATMAMRRGYRQMLADGLAQARARHDAATVVALEAEREPVFLLGGDEITMSLHHALQEQVPTLVTALQDPQGANARIGIAHTSSAQASTGGTAEMSETTDTTDEHLVAFRQGDQVQARVKYYEDRQLALRRLVAQIADEQLRREATARVDALRIDFLYGEYDGGVILRDRASRERHDDATLQRRVDDVERSLPVVHPVTPAASAIRPVPLVEEDLPGRRRRVGEL